MSRDTESGADTSREYWEPWGQFRAVFDNASIGMALTAATGELITTNPAFCTLLGYGPSELEGVHFADITHPDDLADTREWLRTLVGEETSAAHWEKRYLHKDGKTVWARISVAPVTDSGGNLLYFVTQIEDMTARRDAEAAAQASEERFRLTFETAASGMALVEPRTGRFLRVNPAGCRMLGYTEDELLDLSIQDVTASGDREESMTRFRKVVTGELESSAAKLHYLRSDGSTAYAIVSTALARDPSGEPLHLVANVVDITEQVEAQGQLRGLLDSKDQLIASVSHELRTPLTAVLGFAQLLRSEFTSLTSGEQIELIQSIADQTSDLTNIVEDLLVAARADNETLTVVKVPVDLRAQSAQVLEAMGGDPAVGRIRLTADTLRGQGDPARVRQILRNLISNALRYGGEDIEVTTYRDRSRVCVAVLDDGPGIPEDDRDRIFQPYLRSSNTKNVTASIGLGLSVSRMLARLMEGDLAYRHEDGRSVFELSLPAVET